MYVETSLLVIASRNTFLRHFSFLDGFGRFSIVFGPFSDGFGRFRTVSDVFGSFSDGFGRFRIFFGPFWIVSGRMPAVSDDSNPN